MEKNINETKPNQPSENPQTVQKKVYVGDWGYDRYDIGQPLPDGLEEWPIGEWNEMDMWDNYDLAGF